jgi:1-aminocyclopropane-1-carboxylate deaminase/D-cysteine desulfhydrase-like pyridoxal-dependent ACC family enzyme
MDTLLSDLEINATPIQEITDASWVQNNIRLFVKREDLCHPIICGNKWHKLRLNLLEAKKQGCQPIISFGGAWSNHIHALAYACQQESLNFVAIIRGEELANKPLNNTLSDVKRWGAQLVFVSRHEYRLKHNSNYLSDLKRKYKNSYVIPEGGANNLGVEGSYYFALACIEQFYQTQKTYPSHVALACGSGAMSAGFLRALSELNKKLPDKIQLCVYAVVKDKSLLKTISRLASSSLSALPEKELNLFLAYEWNLFFCEGLGFGLSDSTLLDFMLQFQTRFGISLDPVYTAKLLKQLMSDIQEQQYQQGSHVLVIHSGGIQGARSLEQAIDANM